MNATPKLAQFRDFKATLKAIADELGATLTAKGFSPTNRYAEMTVGFPNTAVIVELTYTNYEGHKPALYIGEGTRQRAISNLSAANLKKHLTARLDDARKLVAEIAEEKQKDAATFAAEDAMATALTVELAFDGFTKLKNDDYHIWRSSSLGEIKLAYVGAAKNPKGRYDITYNVEYDFIVSGVMVKGELTAPDLAGIRRTLKALYSL